jgi:hypothetical protein
MLIYSVIMAGFTAPQPIGTNPHSLLWLLPITMAIAAVYKATKLPSITVRNFLKETVVLFGSIIIFIALITLCLFALSWLITE